MFRGSPTYLSPAARPDGRDHPAAPIRTADPTGGIQSLSHPPSVLTIASSRISPAETPSLSEGLENLAAGTTASQKTPTRSSGRPGEGIRRRGNSCKSRCLSRFSTIQVTGAPKVGLSPKEGSQTFLSQSPGGWLPCGKSSFGTPNQDSTGLLGSKQARLIKGWDRGRWPLPTCGKRGLVPFASLLKGQICFQHFIPSHPA